MQLDQLQLSLRRRNAWEALDLGLVMLRHWRGPVYRVWFATFVPFALLVMALLWQWPMVAMLLIWWLKPLFDRILLKVFAEASFGATPSPGAILHALPGLLRRSGLLTSLTLQRISTSRSFDLPVWQLEGQRGKACAARLHVLGRKTRGYAVWLTFVCANAVAILEFGLVGLLDILTPSNGAADFSWLEIFSDEADNWHLQAFNIAWLVAESIIEPFFVAAGFSLYLNRRSELEGWDIEVAFRRMTARQVAAAAGTRSTRGRMTLLAWFVSGLLAWTAASPGDAMAATGEPPALQPEKQASLPAKRPNGAIRQAAEQVLTDPVFGHKVEDTRWQLRQQKEDKKKEEEPWWVKHLSDIAKLLASGTRALICVLALLAGVALLVLMYRYRHLVFGDKPAHIQQPDTLFGLDLRPASLPDDIAGAALAELDAGRHAAALSLLYRGTLVALIRRQHIEFRTGDTEDTCLNRVSGRIDKPAAEYFARLLDAWKHAAYAEIPPDMANARELCLHWAQHFAEPGRAA